MIDRVIGPETRAALARLSPWIVDRGFYLAGGTGCALHLGHRISHDLDFFTPSEFDPSRLWTELRKKGDCVSDYTDAGTWVGNFEGTKAGFFHYPYPLIGNTVLFAGVPVASVDDIGCMKIEAIAGRGRKRDFVDLYFILKKMGFDLATLWGFFQKKYARQSRNSVHILKSLVYFVDADADPDPLMLVEYSWLEIEQKLAELIKTIIL
ncbi:MAG: nucleotidyl transferase AbiEii/AbiGii toxin family protein [Candidatus Aminicenantes bacterium]|nr:nucleotidyl transferase AbiEii/AbiGii toxin family protein [Candidatus Aminicenantes bacterium]